MNKTETTLLFDTNALIDLYRGRQNVRPYLERLLNGELIGYVSVITEAELWRGLKIHEVERHQALLRLFTAIPLHSNAARQAGAWMQQYDTVGLGWMDALIVATATLVKLSVLTRDGRLVRCLAQEAAFEQYTQ